MSCLSGNRQLREQRRISKTIDREIKQEKRRRRRYSEVVVLLLGARGSGKTTLLKTIGSICQHSLERRKGYVSAVHDNILMAIQSLLLGMDQLSIKYENPANDNMWRRIVDIPTHTASYWQ